jgi:hypothetical protein
MKINKDITTGALISIASLSYIQVLSNIVHEKLGILIFILALMTASCINIKKIKSSLLKIIPLLGMIVAGSLVSIIGNFSIEAISFYKYIFYIALAALAWSSASERAKDIYLSILSNLAVIASFSLVAGALYALSGGRAIFKVVNPDGFENSWYLLTFSRENLLGVIRGSWIFDEPGTLSFFLMAVVVARELSSKRKWVTTIIAACGLLTFSTAHLIVFLMLMFYYTTSFIGKYNLKAKLFVYTLIFASALSLLALSPTLDFLTDSLFFSRIRVEDGIFEGNNRANQVQNYLENIDLYGFLFGEPECYEQSSKPKCVPFSDQTSNIFTPIFYSGLLASSPFYVLYFYLIFQIITNIRNQESILLLIMLAILFQRPYFYNPNYILLGMISLRGISNKSLLLNMLLIRKGLK